MSSVTSLPTTMKAVRLRAAGGPEHLAAEVLPTPQPAAGEALVRVHAAAITRGELDWPTDRLPAIPSYELSGVVIAVGPDAADVAVGERVHALTPFDRDGVAAEYAVVPADVLAAPPRTLDHIASAALPLPGLSAWQGLVVHGGLRRGERVLIHGATGGVGHLAVQIARALGAHVVATTSSDGVEAARQLGASQVVDHSRERFEDVVEPVDLIFDTAGGDRLARSPAVLRAGGRLVTVAEEPPAGAGTYFVVEPDRAQLAELAALVDRSALRPAVDAVFPLADARAAFERSLARGQGHGKIVLDVVGA